MNMSLLLKKKFFTQREVNAIFSHISPRTLLALAKEQIVESEILSRDQRGVHRKFSLAHLYQIALVTDLASSGLRYTDIRDIIVDPYLKGVDAEGTPKILNLLNYYILLKIAEELPWVRVDKREDNARWFFVKGPSTTPIPTAIVSERRKILYEVEFVSVESIWFVQQFNDWRGKYLAEGHRAIIMMIVDFPLIVKHLQDNIENLQDKAALNFR